MCYVFTFFHLILIFNFFCNILTKTSLYLVIFCCFCYFFLIIECLDQNILFICVDFQHLEDLWRDARWMVVLQSARYKHQSSGVSLGWIIDFSKESIPEKPASTSSQMDYLPSPTPSPESTRKHNGERE